jgi:hypothetical protein
VLSLIAGGAMAEPKAPSEAQTADASFAKSFLGKTYDDDLVIEGWTDYGGGLVSPPIYVHQYQRDDGTVLVLTSREVAPATSSAPESYVVADALIVPKPPKDVQFVIACVQGDDATLRFMGEAKGPEDQEWWKDVRRAWAIALDTGQIAEVKTKGVRCTNMAWGQ